MTRAAYMSSKKQAIAAGVFGSLTIASGIVATVLYYLFLDLYSENARKMHSAPPFQFWWTPVTFIIPGVLGIAAAVQRRKLLFAFYLAMAMMTLMVTGIFFIIIAIFVVTLPSQYSRSECRVTGSECVCIRDMEDVFSRSTGYADCDKMFEMVIYGHVATGIYTLGWALCFAGALLSCITCNYIERRRSNAIVAYSTRHSPSIKVSTVQPAGQRRSGNHNLAYVYS